MTTQARADLAPEAITRIVLRPLASSLPLGFIAFGAGTVLLSALELGWVPATQASVITILLLAFVVPLELLAGIFAFMARDSGAATGLTVLGAAWAATAAALMKLPLGGRSTALGIFLMFLAATIVIMSAASLRGKPLFGVLLAFGACRFALTGIYESWGNAGAEHAAGWLGVPLLALSLYGGLALLLEDGAQRTVIPLGRRGRARSSIEGDIGRQIEQAEQEPGIRRQL